MQMKASTVLAKICLMCKSKYVIQIFTGYGDSSKSSYLTIFIR